MAHDVLISYSSKDKPKADAICNRLESQGIRCWIAPRDVPLGREYADSIVEAIESSRVIVLIYSNNADQSHQVRREIERAVSKGIAIVPVRIEDARMSKSFELYVSSLHWLDAITPPLDQHIDKLARDLKVLLSRNDATTAAGSVSRGPASPQTSRHNVYPSPQPASNQSRWMAGGVIGVILAGTLFFVLRSNEQPEAPAVSESQAAATPASSPPAPAEVSKDGPPAPAQVSKDGRTVQTPQSPASSQQWNQLPGLGKDIGVGADGSAWLIGTNPAGGPADFGIYKWNGTNWDSVDGGGVRIAVGPDGQPWVLNSAGEIYHRQGNSWRGPLPGQGRDIGVGADGSVWLIGTDFGIYKWNGTNWDGVDGAGVRIAVGPDGQPWVVNSAGEIYHRQGNSWRSPLPGQGKDIGVGGDGSVWLIGTNAVGSGADFGVYKWNGTNWDGVDHGGVGIAVGPDGKSWLVNSAGLIFRRL